MDNELPIGEAATAAGWASSPAVDPWVRVLAFVTHARHVAGDGLTLAEFVELLVALVRMAMQIMVPLDVDGSAKKAWVLQAAGHLFDVAADRCVPAVVYPAWLVVRPWARIVVLAIASGTVEALLPTVRS